MYCVPFVAVQWETDRWTKKNLAKNPQGICNDDSPLLSINALCGRSIVTELSHILYGFLAKFFSAFSGDTYVRECVGDWLGLHLYLSNSAESDEQLRFWLVAAHRSRAAAELTSINIASGSRLQSITCKSAVAMSDASPPTVLLQFDILFNQISYWAYSFYLAMVLPFRENYIRMWQLQCTINAFSFFIECPFLEQYRAYLLLKYDQNLNIVCKRSGVNILCGNINLILTFGT